LSIARLAILTRRQLEMPMRQERFLLILADTASGVGLDFEPAFPADVVEVGFDATELRSAAGDLQHDLRNAPNSARNLCDLRGTESAAQVGNAAKAVDVENGAGASRELQNRCTTTVLSRHRAREYKRLPPEPVSAGGSVLARSATHLRCDSGRGAPPNSGGA